MKRHPNVCGLDWSDALELANGNLVTWPTFRFRELWRFAQEDMEHLGFEFHPYMWAGVAWNHNDLTADVVEEQVRLIERRIDDEIARRLGLAAGDDVEMAVVVSISRFATKAYRGKYREHVADIGRRIVLCHGKKTDIGPIRVSYNFRAQGRPTSRFSIDPSNFVVTLGLPPTWGTSVHRHRLDALPPSPVQPPIFVLDVQPANIHDKQLRTALATWTKGGTAIVDGHIAWRADAYDRSVQAWGVGATAQRAVNKLQAFEDARGPIQVNDDDAAAMMEAFQ